MQYEGVTIAKIGMNTGANICSAIYQLKGMRYKNGESVKKITIKKLLVYRSLKKLLL